MRAVMSEAALLLRISQSLSRQRERAGLARAIGEALPPALGCERATLVLAEAAAEAPGSLPAWVIAHRQARTLADLGDAAELAASERALRDQGLRSAVALPLLVRERCLGALVLAAARPGAFEARPSAVLEELAAAVAGALDTCLAYEEVERLGQERKALLEVNVAVGRHHLERDALFGAMAGCLRDLVPTQRFGIELPIEGEQLQGHVLTPGGAAGERTRQTLLPAAGTACDWVLRTREWVVVGEREELRSRFPVTFDVMSAEGMQSLCALPLANGDRCRGALFFMAAEKGAYASLRRDFLEQVAGAVGVAVDDCLAHEEVRRLRDRLAAENVYLKEEIQQEHNFGAIVGRSPALRQVLAKLDTLAAADATVLVLGETGTGKELIARAIHDRSRRRDRPLVKVNCAAISAGLVESELFGHVKGAFTGATADRTGRFELADGGTIFLDEIGELPLETQVKLLRVLQERELEPVGSSDTRKVDVRVITATNRDLEKEVAAGRFRSDLYYRINVLPIRVPPLRERREDIPLLVHSFVDRFAREMGKSIRGVPRATMERLQAYDWPGNVRELQNVIERGVVLATGDQLELGADFPAAPAARAELPPALALPGSPSSTLEEIGRQHMLQVLQSCDWVVEGEQGAARLLGLQPSTLRSRMRKFGLQRPAR